MDNVEHYILMADIIGSRTQDQNILSKNFKKLTTIVNDQHKSKMTSPITVTLGDEFQCITSSLVNSMEIIFLLEEEIINLSINLKLRYVISKGKIASEINKEIAWGMMGDGLTHTREFLNSIKKTRKRFFTASSVVNHSIINEALFIYQSIMEDWSRERDFPVIKAYIKSESKDYKEIAKRLHKNPDQIWKREKNMKITEYFSIKKIIIQLCQGENSA
ncbi:MAG: SatD family protein [Spirochaetales bacterium]|nr:SatD family protein [Spirochaetales bacterium]